MFKNKLVIREVDRRHVSWEIVEDLIYQGNKDEFLIPKGYITDFASVPKAFWSLISPWGKQLKAAVIHDYLYEYKVVSRKDADGIFLRIMKEEGVSWLKRKIIYRAVRLFGGSYYND